MQPLTVPSRRAVLAALVLVQILFGANYVISKIVVGIFPPLVWGSIRLTVSALAMVVVARASGRKHPPLERAFFVPMILYALLGTIINQSAFLVGLSHTSATNSAILNTLIPIVTLLIITIRGQEPLTLNRLTGFFLAFAGVLVIRKVEDLSLSDKTLIGDSLMILNCVSYALFLSLSKRFLEIYDPLWTTAWLFIYGAIGFAALSAPDWIGFQWPEMSANLWAAAAFAILGATLLTYFLNFWALAHAKTSQVAIFIYLQPIVASTIAWVWFNEVVTLRTVLASLLIFSGLLLAISKRASNHFGRSFKRIA